MSMFRQTTDLSALPADDPVCGSTGTAVTADQALRLGPQSRHQTAATGQTLLANPDARTAFRLVLDCVREVAGARAHGITEETSLDKMGLDSLERDELINAVESRLGTQLATSIVASVNTTGELVQAVLDRMGADGTATSGQECQADGAASPDAGNAASSKGEAARGRNNRQAGTQSGPPMPFSEWAEYSRLQATQQAADNAGLRNPYLRAHDGLVCATTRIDGREYVNFCSYNYVGSAGNPYVIGQAQQAADCFGTSASASRLVSGERPLHRQLERALASWIRTDDAIAMVSGHATNVTTIGHLFGPGDLVLHDALAHNSILQGCQLSGAARRSFPHNDAAACDRLLDEVRGRHRRVLIAIEGVYSMDGDIAPLPDFVRLRNLYGAYLLVDEAHSLGTVGQSGRGLGEHFGVAASDVDLWMGTLSKSLGSCGGYIAGSHALVELLKYTAPGFVYSVGLSPPDAAAALASLELLNREPQRVARLAQNAALFVRLAQEAGLDTGASAGTPIVPVMVGDWRLALHFSERLFERGINVQPILPPAVAARAARLRFFLTSEHTPEQIRTSVAAVAEEYRAIVGGIG